MAGFRAGRGRLARGADDVGQGAPGGHRHPRDRRAPGDGAREGGRPRDRPARRHPRRRAHAHERPRHLRRRRRGRGEGLRHRPVDAHPARRAGQPPGPDRGRRDRRPRLALPRHAGHVDLQDLRGRDRPDGRQREGRSGRLGDTDFEKVYLYQNSHAGLLPGREDAGDQGAVPEVRRAPARRAGARRGRRGQADRRVRDGHPERADGLRPRGGRALLRAAVRQREGPGQLRRDGGRQPPARRHADRALGRHRAAAFLLDVRNPPELAVESVPGAVNIPLPQLRARLGELPRDREIHVICRSAVRAYYATRILLQNGFTAKNISGGMLARSHRAGRRRRSRRHDAAARDSRTIGATARRRLRSMLVARPAAVARACSSAARARRRRRRRLRPPTRRPWRRSSRTRSPRWRRSRGSSTSTPAAGWRTARFFLLNVQPVMPFKVSDRLEHDRAHGRADRQRARSGDEPLQRASATSRSSST